MDTCLLRQYEQPPTITKEQPPTVTKEQSPIVEPKPQPPSKTNATKEQPPTVTKEQPPTVTKEQPPIVEPKPQPPSKTNVTKEGLTTTKKQQPPTVTKPSTIVTGPLNWLKHTVSDVKKTVDATGEAMSNPKENANNLLMFAIADVACALAAIYIILHVPSVLVK